MRAYSAFSVLEVREIQKLQNAAQGPLCGLVA
jgi:hypothetical protein